MPKTTQLRIKYASYTIKDFIRFCKEREKIRIKKESGKPRPYTNDLILHSKKFCNIDRRHDTGTENIIKALECKSDEYKVFGSLIYRICSSGTFIPNELEKFNTAEEFCSSFFNEPIRYNTGKMSYQFCSYKAGVTMQHYCINYILPNYKEVYQALLENKDCSLKQLVTIIGRSLKYPKILRFGIYQALCDLTYYFDFLNDNSDVYLGMGSINCLCAIIKNQKLTQSANELFLFLKKKTKFNSIILEHALCEYDKYSKYILGKKPLNSKITDY